jgi:hypothetical protein
MRCPDDLQETMSFRKDVTGINHVLFISPHGVKVTLDPNSLDPRGSVATVTLNGEVIGKIDPLLLRQIQQFVQINHAVLLAYWRYEIDTNQLQQRLQSID